MRSLGMSTNKFSRIKGSHWIEQSLETRTIPRRTQIQSQRRKAMATEIGSRGSTYPNLAMGRTTASRSGEDVLLVGANVPDDDGPAVKRRRRRRGRDLGDEREEEDEGVEETMRRGQFRWEGKTY